MPRPMILATLALVLGGCGASARPAAIGDGVRVTFSLAEGSPAAAAAVMQRRLEAAKIRGTARAEGDALVVDLAAASDAQIADAQELLSRPGQLDLTLVADGRPLMAQVALRVGAEAGPDAAALAGPRAEDAGIRVEEDQWRGPGQTSHADVYLVAPDREVDVTREVARELGCPKVPCRVSGRWAIERYVAALVAADQLALPADHRLVYEHVAAGGDVRPYWRSYYVERTSRLAPGAIVGAQARGDAQVEVTLGADAARAFGELTRANLGRKLVILLDDRVLSAPIVMAPLAGGRISLALGADARAGDARQLAIVLAAGPLPAAVRLESLARLRGGQVVAPDE